MNRRELFESLAGVLNKFIREPDNTKNTDALVAALNQLRPASPDPDTGLVPCGCGGRAETHELYGHFSGTYMTDCKKCATGTTQYNTKEEAQDAWNTAMGCIAAPMNPWIRTNDQPPTEMDACHNDWVLALAAYQSPDNPVRLPAADIVDWNFPVNCPELYPYWMPLPKLPEVEG